MAPNVERLIVNGVGRETTTRADPCEYRIALVNHVRWPDGVADRSGIDHEPRILGSLRDHPLPPRRLTSGLRSRRMRGMRAWLVLAVVASGCGGTAELSRRAAYDLDCRDDEIVIVERGAGLFTATGCGRTGRYQCVGANCVMEGAVAAGAASPGGEIDVACTDAANHEREEVSAALRGSRTRVLACVETAEIEVRFEIEGGRPANLGVFAGENEERRACVARAIAEATIAGAADGEVRCRFSRAAPPATSETPVEPAPPPSTQI